MNSDLNKHTNALIHSQSPYLLQHAHNPVQWYEWGEMALNKAKEEINNGSLVFCIHPRWPFRQEEELIELLNIQGVKYRDLGPFPDVLPIDRNCYHETMDYYIREKFGESFHF
jgi:hypothetical protein